MPKDVEACVRSVMDDNPDMDEDSAYAVCQDMKNKGELQEDGTPPEDYEISMNNPFIAQSRGLANADQIGRQELENDHVKYTNVELLAPGEWTDSMSRTTYYYSEQGIKNSLDNWIDKHGEPTDKAKLHLNHDGQDTILADIGYVDTETVRTNSDGAMVGDIVFYRDTDQSKNAEKVMQRIYDSNGELSGDFGPSVEIVDTQDEWNDERGLMETKEMVFSGVGFVTSPASQTISFDQQISALSDQAEKAGFRMLQKDKDTDPETSGMGDETDPIQRLREARENLERELQDGEEMDMVMDILGMAQSEGFDPSENTIADLMEFVEANLDVSEDQMGALQDIASAAIESAEGDAPDAVGAEAMVDWIEQNMGEEEADEEGDAEEEENEGEMSDDAKERFNELESRIDSLAESMPELSEMEEEMNALAEALEQTTRELEKVKDEPDRRALSEEAGEPDDSSSENAKMFSGGPAGRDSTRVL